MKRVLWVMALLAAMLALPAFARPASALSCLHPGERIGEMQTVILGRIVAVPKKQFAEIEVEKYYRGSGVARLLVEFRGVGGGPNPYEWALTPQVGTYAIFELNQDEKGIFLGPCNLNAAYDPQQPFVAEILQKLGEGTPPQPGSGPVQPEQPATGSGRMLWILLGAGAVAVVAGGAIFLSKRRI